MSQTQASGDTAQVGIPLIRNSPDLIHQENFSKDIPYDKTSVKHLAEGWRGDGRRPFAVFLCIQAETPQD